MASKLYLISPPEFDLAEFKDQLESAISGGEIAAFQLRMKNVPDAEIIKAAELLLPICRPKNIIFIINDSVQLAKTTGADGVHLGSDDGDVKRAREVLGDHAVIGASCYNSIDLAINAAQAGADYVSFGAFYPTKTKVAKAKAEIETLEKWAFSTNVKCSAIGGINPQNCKPIVKAGADFICAISAVWDHPVSPAKAVEEFNSALSSKTV